MGKPASGANSSWPVRPRAFQVMVKPRGSICNLDCNYCFYLKKEKLYPDGHFRMSDALLEDFTRQYIEAQNVPEITFAWQGGEPSLMGLDFFRKAVDLQEKYRKPGMRINNAFQTNGTLLDGEWCRFFHEHQFLIGLSIDGPRDLHDTYRRDKGGRPTFDRVVRAAELLQQHNVDFNTLTCVSAGNVSRGLDVYRFLRDDLGARFMQFIPIIERENETGWQEGQKLTNRSITGPQYGRFLIDVFDEWVRSDIGNVFVQIFDAALAAWIGERPGLCVFDETCGLAAAMEFNGDVYSCDHFVEPRCFLGNIQEQPLADLISLPAQYRFGIDKKESLPAYCRACEVRFICNGGCPKNRVMNTPDGEPGLNALCAGYRAFFNYIDRPMNLMAALLRANRAPAEIKRLLAGKLPLRDTPDGAPCPCESGKPVERCHRSPKGYIPPGQTAPPPSKNPGGRRRH
ncbi:MAG: anaerobic sulfatase maturase [Chloroflexi bacterium]|nr:anaerobic sulfatase maturase [Chloroflexota bacterium]